MVGAQGRGRCRHGDRVPLCWSAAFRPKRRFLRGPRTYSGSPAALALARSAPRHTTSKPGHNSAHCAKEAREIYGLH